MLDEITGMYKKTDEHCRNPTVAFELSRKPDDRLCDTLAFALLSAGAPVLTVYYSRSGHKLNAAFAKGTDLDQVIARCESLRLK